MNKSREFASLQKGRFSRAERRRFLWQTENSYVRERERELLATLCREKSNTILEVGCGEGANISNVRALGCKTKFIGIDFSEEKVAFCRSCNPDDCLILCGDAIDLPFSDCSFDLVFCRDLLHHVNNYRKEVIAEMIRVCKRNAKIAITESNGMKLTVFLLAAICPAERGMMDSTPNKITRIVKEFDGIVELKEFCMLEPSNLFRVVLHYRFGLPLLANLGWFRRCLDCLRLVSKRVIPKNRWAYSLLLLRKL